MQLPTGDLAFITLDDPELGACPWEHRSFYNGKEITQPRQRWTREEQLQLLDTHPMFTGRCPQCGSEIERDITGLWWIGTARVVG